MSADHFTMEFNSTDPELLSLFVSRLGEGFDVYSKIFENNKISVSSLGISAEENELIEKLIEIGVSSRFHQKVVARSILAWKFPSPLVTSSETPEAFPIGGITFSLINNFIEECGGRSVLNGLSTSDVNKRYLKPLTIHMKSSYCDYLKTIDVNSVREAQVFISHAWEYKFLDLVDSLQNHFGQNSDKIFWIDLFSINQHIAQNLDFPWWSTTFRSAIAKMNHTVLVCSPWLEPTSLTRSWCLYEIYCTVDSNCKFEVAMSSSEENNFLETIKYDAFDSYNRMLAAIDTENSNASKPEDKKKIFDAVSTVGFDRIDSIVSSRLREWVIETIKKSIRGCSNDEERGSALKVLGSLYQIQGQNDSAENALLQSLNLFEKLESKNLRKMMQVQNCLALLYQNMKRFSKALSYSQLCFDTAKELYGESNEVTLQYMNNLAGLLKWKGNRNKASSLYEKCLALRKEVLGEEDPDTLQTMNNLALLYQGMRRDDDALTLFKKCLDLRKRILGEKSPDTLQSMNNLAIFYHRKYNYELALDLFNNCLALREEVLGENHLDTLKTMNNLALLYQHKRRDNEALPLFQKCLNRRLIVFGDKHTDTLKSKKYVNSILARMNMSIESSLSNKRQRNY